MDDRRRDGGTNSTLRIKEQGTHLTLNEHDDDDDDDQFFFGYRFEGEQIKITGVRVGERGDYISD